MDAAAAVHVPIANCTVKQICPECGGRMATIRSRVHPSGRIRRFECRTCGHRMSLGGENADQPVDRHARNIDPSIRRFDAATIKAIRESTDGRRVLAKQYGCSQTMIRDIVAGRCYKDLLPEGFRSPPKPGDPNCERCRYWEANACGMGFPDPVEEGPSFARDCSLYAVEG